MRDNLEAVKTLLALSLPCLHGEGGLEAAVVWMQVHSAASLTQSPGRKQEDQDPDRRPPRPSDSHLSLPETAPRGSSKSHVDCSRSVCLFPQ